MRLHPLSLRQIETLIAGAREIAGIEILPGALPPAFILVAALAALREGKSPRWHSPRLFVAPESGAAVGTGGFKGAPASGRVEIGYGIAENCRGRGFATAAVLRLVDVARNDSIVTEIYAETAVANGASRRVVEKSGFCRIGERMTVTDGAVDRWLLQLAAT